MSPSLRALLDHPIDYAGLFPPAQLGMAASVNEFLQVRDSADAWILNRFVCSVSRLGELAKELKAKSALPVPVTVVGSPLEGDPGARVRHDAIEIQEARSRGSLEVQAFEVKVPTGTQARAAVAAVKRLPALAQDPGIDLFLEVGWEGDFVDTMHEAASMLEDVGFKARTGGLVAEAFPSCETLAVFISECAALEAPCKFTAGLHEPFRHFDERLGVHRHGFLNVMLASALAVTGDLSRNEIAAILELEEPSKFHFGADDVKVGEHWLEAGHIPEFLDHFGGFGSCSVDEPIEGLRRLGLLEGAPA